MKTNTLSPIIQKALDLAVKHHKDDVRKGTKIPYLVHLLNVQGILAGVTSDDEVISAGLLHDIVEDTSVTIDEIKTLFGNRISDIVTACTEKYKLEKTEFDASKSWKERKEHTINDVIPTVTADQLLVILADKLDNIRSIKTDYLKIHDKLWGRFNAGKYQQQWYYKSILDAGRKNPNLNEQSKDLLREISDSLNLIFSDLVETDNIRIIIANDHKIMRDALKIIFKQVSAYDVIGEASNFQETIALVAQKNSDILILDDQMPGGDIYELLKAISELDPELKIIIQSLFKNDADHFKQIISRVNGWISVSAVSKNYLEAIETVYLGGFYGLIPGFRKKN